MLGALDRVQRVDSCWALRLEELLQRENKSAGALCKGVSYKGGSFYKCSTDISHHM